MSKLHGSSSAPADGEAATTLAAELGLGLGDRVGVGAGVAIGAVDASAVAAELAGGVGVCAVDVTPAQADVTTLITNKAATNNTRGDRWPSRGDRPELNPIGASQPGGEALPCSSWRFAMRAAVGRLADSFWPNERARMQIGDVETTIGGSLNLPFGQARQWGADASLATIGRGRLGGPVAWVNLTVRLDTTEVNENLRR